MPEFASLIHSKIKSIARSSARVSHANGSASPNEALSNVAATKRKLSSHTGEKPIRV